MEKQLWFRSSKFSSAQDEDQETNPGRFGKSLAAWVRTELAAQGRSISEEPIPEDWGWMVVIHRKPFLLWVGCGNETGNPQRWSLFVEAEQGLVRKLFKPVDFSAEVTALEQQLERIIKTDPECRDVEWEIV